MPISELNPAQQEAVKYIAGPCLVVAGAGSGKTKVITEKIIYLLNECRLRGREICAVTFTNKAAREMRTRIARLAPADQLRGILITTFHSLGLYMLRRDYVLAGLKKNFILMDANDQKTLVSSMCQEILGSDKTPDQNTISRVLASVSRAKMSGLTPDEFMEKAASDEDVFDAAVYRRYDSAMNAYSAADFDDLVLKPTRIMRDHEGARLHWQKRFKHILVDEYQDTNEVQYDFLKLLIGSRERFTFVGDDDQSIYAWRGADPRNIERLSTDYPNLKVIKLEQNYRSCGRILHVANELIARNRHIIAKTLYSSYGYGDPIVIHECPDPRQEAEYVCAELTSQQYRNRYRWRHFGILYRTNHQSREMEKSLRENRIPYRINGDISFFERAEVKDTMAYFRVLHNLADDNALLRIINVPRREIGSATVAKIGDLARSTCCSLFDAMSLPDLAAILPAHTLKAVRDFREMILEKRGEIDSGRAAEVTGSLLESIDYMSHLLGENSDEKVARIKYDNALQVKDWLLRKLKGDPSEGAEPQDFDSAVTSLCLREMLDQTGEEDEQAADQVQLMTIHAAKGLEFEFVFLIGCEENILPHKNSLESGSIEEERRLMYVGITRAKHHLVISHCLTRMQDRTQISRFIGELPQDDLKIEDRESEKKVDPDESLAFIAQLRASLKN